nr:sulfur carrier protein ThiS [uncultured Dorea sp.]
MIIVNGKEINLTKDTSVAEYLEQNRYQVKRIAVELNGDILPKYSYSDTMLKDGDRLEVVTFVGGG